MSEGSRDDDEGSADEDNASRGNDVEMGNAVRPPDDVESQQDDSESISDASDDDQSGATATDDSEPSSPDEKSPVADSTSRAALRKMMSESQRSVLASISQASKADAEKGQAVKEQRQTFDTLLNTRIRLQKALVATNSLAATATPPSVDDSAYAAAESAAFTLWVQLDELRSSLQPPKRKHDDVSTSTPLSTVWNHMQSQHDAALPGCQATLEKWAAKSRATSTISTSRRLNNTPREQSLTEVLKAQLTGPSAERLTARTRVARSCAPLQAGKATASAKDPIFDDADFYALLLKELVEQRTSSAAAAGSAAASAAAASSIIPASAALRLNKTHRANVDTKASKGRKLRYTVHEKLQNFMAPEDPRVGAWEDRQVGELFSSLLGQRNGLREDDSGSDDEEDEDDGGGENGQLRLF